MSLTKKIVFLVLAFVILNIVSIYKFDYSNNDIVIKSDFAVFEKISNFFTWNKKVPEDFRFILTKKDNLIEMSGLFAKIDDSKRVANTLGINRDGDISYKEGVKIDEKALVNIFKIITPFKDYFADGSIISIENGVINLKGELKDENYKNVLDAILSKLDTNIQTDIKMPQIALENTEENVVDKSEIEEEQKLVQNEMEEVKSIIEKDKTEEKDNQKELSNEELQEKINQILKEEKLNFKRASSDLTPESKKTVESIAKILVENSSANFEVAGHTDSKGKAELNKRISQDRADTVKNLLVSLGVNQDRIKAVGYGKEFRIAEEDEYGLSEINRRVEIVMEKR